MRYEESNAGRVDREASGDGSFWTFEGVEERLVETVRCWWRMPGGGHWPFATDGPWHLIKSELYGPDVDRDAPLRPLPLRRAEIAAMEEATEWMTWVAEDKRRILVLGIGQLARGRRQVRWGEIKRTLGIALGSGGLEWRYSQAVALIANVLNAMAGNVYAPKGVRVRYPRAVVAIVERLKMAENCARNLSSPVIFK